MLPGPPHASTVLSLALQLWVAFGARLAQDARLSEGVAGTALDGVGVAWRPKSFVRAIGLQALLATAGAIDQDVGMMPTDVAQAMELMDSDRNGVLDFGEFKRGVFRMLSHFGNFEDGVRLRVLRFYRKVFARADVNGDGRLSPAELDFADRLDTVYGPYEKQAIATGAEVALHDFGQERGMHILAEYDVDGDGKVAKNEFVRGVHEFFVRWSVEEHTGSPNLTQWVERAFNRSDCDSNGFLTPSEVLFAALVFDQNVNDGYFGEVPWLMMRLFWLDKNENRVIEGLELERGMDLQSRGADVGLSSAMLLRLQQQFGAADTDGDGALSEFEASRLLASIVREPDSSEP